MSRYDYLDFILVNTIRFMNTFMLSWISEHLNNATNGFLELTVEITI